MSNKSELKEPSISYGLLDDSSIFSLISSIKNGIKYSLFEQLSHLSGFTLFDWSSFLHISERSIQRYKKDGGRFGVVSSEKIVGITMLYKFGIDVFGGKQRFDSWLNIESVALGGLTPKSFLDTSFGIELVKDELIRIEQGVLA